MSAGELVPGWAEDLVRGLPALVPQATVAKLLGVTVRTVAAWRRRGRMASIKTHPGDGAGRALVPRSEVLRLLVEMSKGGGR